ncbi:hypothetical protein CG419_04925 [Latilactobacillus curvatus]|uniref:OmpR/PhoB-type domain-containing protein n=1 Tax=Latilactobacillus curvatus TaxID=28038 RepID=A0AAC9Y054_LATCU|nr:hypothetical protein CG419_04925 [Latilactobacillus curvatus]
MTTKNNCENYNFENSRKSQQICAGFSCLSKGCFRHEANELIVSGVVIDLPKKERDVLSFLIKHRNQVVTRDQLIHNIWGIEFNGDERTVDVHIKRLRDKLQTSDLSIVSVRGVGYKLEVNTDE